MESQAELATRITAATAAIAKIGGETSALLDRVADLQAAIDAQGNVSPEVVDALAALEAQVRVVDDLVPDTEPEPPADPVV